MPMKDSTGPRKSSAGPRDGRGNKRRSALGVGKKKGGRKGNC